MSKPVQPELRWHPTRQLYRRWDVMQLFHVSRSVLQRWERDGLLTPRRMAQPKRRRRVLVVTRRGRNLRIRTRGPLVLYHVAQLRTLHAHLLLMSQQTNPQEPRP